MQMLLVFCFVLLVSKGYYNLSGATPLIGKNVRIAEPNEFPFIVSLGWKFHGISENVEKYHFCGGSLLTTKHVLTAAHCLQKLRHRNEIIVKIGSSDLRKAQNYRVERWISYNQWANNDISIEILHDIAIVELSSEVSPEVELASMTNIPSNNFPGEEATITGWGRVETNLTSRYLKTALVKILPYEECFFNIGITDFAVQNQHESYCTVAVPYVLSRCGDSGSPLLANGKEVIGVNKGHCFLGDQSTLCQTQNAHTSVNYYKPFIANVTGIKFDSKKTKPNACSKS